MIKQRLKEIYERKGIGDALKRDERKVKMLDFDMVKKKEE